MISFLHRYAHFRFTPVYNRLGQPSSSHGISAFGIIGENGCIDNTSLPSTFDSEFHAVAEEGASIYVSFAEPVRMRGWFVNTSTKEGSLENDPSYFEVS